MKKVICSYEVTEQILRGYLIFFFGALLPIIANYFMIVLRPLFFVLPVFSMLYVRLLIVFSIVSIIAMFYGVYAMIAEGLLAGAYSEVTWILWASFCIIVVGFGWTLFFWNLSLTPLEWLMASYIFAMNYREGVVGLGILQIILGFCFLGKSMLVNRGLTAK
ncbi:MAG: hypothetical protein ACFE8O_12755 [Candidatus Hermodarchaeota archaeon]